MRWLAEKNLQHGKSQVDTRFQLLEASQDILQEWNWLFLRAPQYEHGSDNLYDYQKQEFTQQNKVFTVLQGVLTKGHILQTLILYTSHSTRIVTQKHKAIQFGQTALTKLQCFQLGQIYNQAIRIPLPHTVKFSNVIERKVRFPKNK